MLFHFPEFLGFLISPTKRDFWKNSLSLLLEQEEQKGMGIRGKQLGCLAWTTMLCRIASNWREDPADIPAWTTGSPSLSSLVKKMPENLEKKKSNSIRSILLFPWDPKSERFKERLRVGKLSSDYEV